MSQHMDALGLANEIRLARSAVKHGLHGHTLTLSDALERPCVRNMPIAEMLGVLPRYGPQRVTRLLVRVRISEDRKIGTLTARERKRIVSAVAGVEMGDPWSTAA